MAAVYTQHPKTSGPDSSGLTLLDLQLSSDSCVCGRCYLTCKPARLDSVESILLTLWYCHHACQCNQQPKRCILR